MPDTERLIAALTTAAPDDTKPVDEAEIERLSIAIGELAEDDFVTQMVGTGDFTQSFEGVDGMRAALTDWARTFTEMLFQPEGVEEAGETIIIDARQVGVTRHGGVKIEQPSAVVFMYRGERIHRVEFHLDRDAARRSAQSTQA